MRVYLYLGWLEKYNSVFGEQVFISHDPQLTTLQTRRFETKIIIHIEHKVLIKKYRKI